HPPSGDLHERLFRRRVDAVKCGEAHHALIADRRYLHGDAVVHHTHEGHHAALDEIYVLDRSLEIAENGSNLQVHRLELRGKCVLLLRRKPGEELVAKAWCGLLRVLQGLRLRVRAHTSPGSRTSQECPGEEHRP